MKISKRQLRRIIREEKAKLLNEAGPGSNYHSVSSADGSYAVGAYFDVKMMDQFNLLMYNMFENAMTAAKEDGHDAEYAYNMVMRGFDELIEDAQTDMRY